MMVALCSARNFHVQANAYDGGLSALGTRTPKMSLSGLPYAPHGLAAVAFDCLPSLTQVRALLLQRVARLPFR